MELTNARSSSKVRGGFLNHGDTVVQRGCVFFWLGGVKNTKYNEKWVIFFCWVIFMFVGWINIPMIDLWKHGIFTYMNSGFYGKM